MVHLYQDNPVGGANQLNSLLDVNISNPENKQIIYYDSTTGTWRNYNPPFVDHDDILHTIEECTASTDPNDVAGAAVASALNGNLLNLIKWKAISSSPAITVSANDVGTVQFNFTCDTGYKPLFILCGGASTTAVIPIRGGYPLSDNATSCSIQVREITGTTRTNVTLGATLFQIKATSR